MTELGPRPGGGGLGTVQRRLRTARTGASASPSTDDGLRRCRLAGRGDASLDGPLLAVELDIGLGDGAASYLASDLTVHDYVRINADTS